MARLLIDVDQRDETATQTLDQVFRADLIQINERAPASVKLYLFANTGASIVYIT